MKSLKKFLKSKKYSSIPLRLTATNHFEMKARLNGVSGSFILDTGASNTCVGLDKADFFKMKSQESDVKAAGAGATDMETLLSKKNTLEIGDWNTENRKVILFDLGHVNEALTLHKALPVDGIIGADILKKGRAIIDYNKKKLYLKA